MKSFPHILSLFIFLSILLPDSQAVVDQKQFYSTTPSRKIKLKRGTKITLQLNTTVNSKNISTNSVVEMMVVLDVKEKGESQPIILSGTYAEGLVTSAHRAGIFGRGAKIEVEGINVRAIDGQRIPIKSIKVIRNGKNRKRLAYGASILAPAVGVIVGSPWLIPLAAIGIIIRGKEVEIPMGTLVTAKTLMDMEIYL